MTDTINLLIKPSSKCNLRCRYCFYACASESRTLYGDGFMSMHTLEALVSKAYTESLKRVIFAFQGGEPTLVGLDFFKTFMGFIAKYSTARVTTEFSIQTNGTTINNEWADFFVSNGFLVGISLDGNSGLHNANRIDPGGNGTFNNVSAALRLLQRKNAETNILCVVTKQTARRAEAIYALFKKMGCRYLQFVPCLDPENEKRGQRAYSLSPERYGDFLKRLFDLWYSDWLNRDYVSIRLFDDYVHILAGRRPASCATSGICGQYLVVESDGCVYPCDFYTNDEWSLGYIQEKTLAQLTDSGKRFIHVQKNEKCVICKYFNVCRCGCKRDRIDGIGENYYCAAYYSFFDYAMERLLTISSQERKVAATLRLMT